MIVSARDAERIHSGRQTQMRLPAIRRVPSQGYVPITYRQPNEALGYQRNGEPRTEPIRACSVRILERWHTTLGAATDADAQAEGFKDREELLSEWRVDPAMLVVVVRFELDKRHHPRLLAARITAHRQGPYTETPALALPDEPEAVDPFTQERFAKEANERDLLRRDQRIASIALLPFEEQVNLLAQEARARHIDVRDELRAIRRWTSQEARLKQLEKMRAKLTQQVAA